MYAKERRLKKCSGMHPHIQTTNRAAGIMKRVLASDTSHELQFHVLHCLKNFIVAFLMKWRPQLPQLLFLVVFSFFEAFVWAAFGGEHLVCVDLLGAMIASASQSHQMSCIVSCLKLRECLRTRRYVVSVRACVWVCA